jgi:transformation/transcription domain-associated protein
MCHAEDWTRKMAGTAALRGLLVDGDVPSRWVLELEIDVVRALLYCLRDSPKEFPTSVDDVVSMVKHFIKTCQSSEEGRNQKQQRLIDTLVTELSSPNKLARDSAHEFIALLAEVNDRPISELVGPTAKTKLLDGPSSPVFNKPLRALPFALQIGVIDAVTWLIELRPPVVEYTDEFIRLFHEVLALADVDDQSLVAKPGQLKNEQWLKTLRISCIRLLRSSMATADFLDKPNLAQLRPRQVLRTFLLETTLTHVESSKSTSSTCTLLKQLSSRCRSTVCGMSFSNSLSFRKRSCRLVFDRFWSTWPTPKDSAYLAWTVSPSSWSCSTIISRSKSA